MKNRAERPGRACMVANTPFQILGCVAMVKQLELDADLYIGDLFQNSQEVCRKLQDLHIFKNVILVHERGISDESISSKIKKRLKQIPVYVRLNRIVESFLLREENYDQIYISNNSVICRLAYLYLYRKDKNVKIVYYDDGMGSYCNAKIMSISKIEYLYWLLFVGPDTRKIRFSARLYAPKLYLDTMKNCHNFTSVDPIAPLKRTPENDEIIRSVFSVASDCKIGEKVVVLDTIRHVEFVPAGMERIGPLYDRLNERYKGSLIFKQHPKDFSQNAGYTYFQQRHIPFEAVCYFADLTEKVLLTNLSTAAFTPKMLFGQEPVIISLYGIMNQYLVQQNNFEDLLVSFQQSYADPGRIHVPKSEEELIALLDHYLL